MDTSSAGIYSITNITNGEKYVGSAVNLSRRFKRHRHDLRYGKHPNRHLQSAWKKYGEAAFTFAMIEKVTEVGALLPREQYWIDTLHPAYNILSSAGSNLGYSHRSDSRSKIAASLMRHAVSEETRAKIRASKLGHKQDPEQIAKRVATTKARGKTRKDAIASPEARERMSAAHKDSTHTPETRAKIAAAVKQRMSTPEGRAAALKAIIGRPVSEETRAKIGAKHRGKIMSPESRAKMSESAKRRCERRRQQRASEVTHG